VSLRVRPGAGRVPLDAAFAGLSTRICGSGTQALAMALMDAKSRSSVEAPEVVLPAYGCPDLVAASVYAGVQPRLVDTTPGQWGYDLDGLAAAITGSTVAVVAVNLLGTGDQAPELREITAARGVALIQDSAQHLPQEFPVRWLGEYVVLSFGRGKPLNLLRGGALLHAPDRTPAFAAMATRSMAGALKWRAARRLAGLAFNVATHPWIYGFSRKLLGSSVGGTRYRPLDAIESASPEEVIEVESALAGYRQHTGYDARLWSAACAAWRSGGVEMLSCASSAFAGPLKLRLAMLARDSRMRDEIVTTLDGMGLGGTNMYGASMERLAGVPSVVATQGEFPNARNLAARLFTLPTHSAVSPQAVQLARAAVSELLAKRS
jgi:dTDP-4-amino-4,6-dideoxygalactose transaminase